MTPPAQHMEATKESCLRFTAAGVLAAGPPWTNLGGGGGGGVLPRRVQVIPPPYLAVRAPRDDLVREFKNFKRSAPPSRVLFFAGGAWHDFPPAVVGALREGFVAGRPILEVHMGGSRCLFDFVRMVLINAATAAEKYIAWIDVQGRRFFPSMAVEVSRKPGIQVRADKNDGATPAVRKTPPPEPIEEHSDESSGGLDRSSWGDLQLLDERDKLYKVVEKIFLAGMRRSAPAARITSICRSSNGSPSGQSRLKLFHMQAQMTKAARGTANVKYGWYGAPAAGVAGVIRHGFGQPNNGSLHPGAQAIGVYLSPPDSPHASALLSDPDDAGERHVVLCRVIMGNAEKVDMDTPRWHPGGDEFDSGMDDLEKPRWYIVWATHMNTHILPEYLVSFKNSEPGPRVRREPNPGKTAPNMHSIPIRKVFAELAKSLPSSKMGALETLCSHLESRKITRDTFLSNLRVIAGDELRTAVKRLRNNSCNAHIRTGFCSSLLDSIA